MREEWKVNYTGKKLLEAAESKKKFHTDRCAWWKGKKEEVMGQIRAEGLEVTESIVDELGKSGYATSSNVGYDMPQVKVRTDLLQRVKETTLKVREHEGKIVAYDAWAQMLAAHQEETFPVEHEDWMYFFGNLASAQQ